MTLSRVVLKGNMSDAVVSMSETEKVAEAMRRSLPHLPGAARAMVETLLKPETIAIIAGTLVLWAGSHFVGVGEIVDAILLGVGVVFLGLSVFEGAGELLEFARVALRASSSDQLDQAGRHFARAVTILGISTIQALLLRGQGRAVVNRGMPTYRGRIKLSAPPPAGNQLRISRPASIPGARGTTDPYGVIRIARNQSMTEQRTALFHELVHRYLSPRTGPLRKLRAEIAMTAYTRSALLKYLEEALAQGYGVLRSHGLAQAVEALRFPLTHGYVTISQIAAEGQTLGTITLGGVLFRVSIAQGSIPEQPE